MRLVSYGPSIRVSEPPMSPLCVVWVCRHTTGVHCLIRGVMDLLCMGCSAVNIARLQCCSEKSQIARIAII